MSTSGEHGTGAVPGPGGVPVLRLPGRGAMQDLATFTGRARRVDPDGAVRLVLRDTLLAAYVSPVHGGGGPTVLGLRVARLPGPGAAHDLDLTVPLSGLADRFARVVAGGLLGPDAPIDLPLPLPARGVEWAGVSPPRTGWDVLGTVPEALVQQAARDGAREVAEGAGDTSGGAAVARLRAAVWGREVPGTEGLPAGAAFAADALGFVVPGEPVVLHRAGRWLRLTTRHGHVLARPALLSP
ncbi:hypothetical protein GCM10025868_10460 [Angustibacter aerolatus]|uniref:Uncharacterized protein n=1 Tax=Angustibacter aerolatus TaxID=1162965 RepID=A0ABQ6JC85_9ACTN|nr:hypothetical protein [Angustibacter aerolatus]GMA85796.1 hypothetical protein GCM10025868_10460 [Angustibacter aerolatus]